MAFKPSFEVSDQGILASLHNAAYAEVEKELKDKRFINSGCDVDISKLKNMLKKYEFDKNVFQSKKGIYEICAAVQIDKITSMTKPNAPDGMKAFIKDKKAVENYSKTNEKAIKTYFDKEIKPIFEDYCTTFGGKDFASATKDISKLEFILVGSLDDLKTKDFLIETDISNDVNKAAIAFIMTYSVGGNQ